MAVFTSPSIQQTSTNNIMPGSITFSNVVGAFPQGLLPSSTIRIPGESNCCRCKFFTKKSLKLSKILTILIINLVEMAKDIRVLSLK
jgi:hypothetical protein